MSYEHPPQVGSETSLGLRPRLIRWSIKCYEDSLIGWRSSNTNFIYDYDYYYYYYYYYYYCYYYYDYYYQYYYFYYCNYYYYYLQWHAN